MMFWNLIKEAVSEWSTDKAPRIGAALAYYTVFAFVPLLIIVIAGIGLVFGQEAAQSYIFAQISSLLGEQSGAAIKDMIQRASRPATGLIATITAVVTLLLGASGLFAELQDALNTIWGVKPKEDRGLMSIIRHRFLSFVALLGTGFLLLVSLVISAALAALGKWFEGWLPMPEFVLEIVNILVSLGVIAGLFAMMFKVLPDAEVAWKDVWIGACLTAVLFTVGKFAIGLYLGKSDVGSAYGAVASLVILLIWVYYSSQIFLFGAEFTKVYANALGSKILPADDAGAASPATARAQNSLQSEKKSRRLG